MRHAYLLIAGFLTLSSLAALPAQAETRCDASLLSPQGGADVDCTALGEPLPCLGLMSGGYLVDSTDCGGDSSDGSAASCIAWADGPSPAGVECRTGPEGEGSCIDLWSDFLFEYDLYDWVVGEGCAHDEECGADPEALEGDGTLIHCDQRLDLRELHACLELFDGGYPFLFDLFVYTTPECAYAAA